MENIERSGAGAGPLQLVRVLRPRQWTKNLIAFTPLLFSHRFGEQDALLSVAITTFCLCLVSGSVYVANDIADREADSVHPTKRKRPVASGQVSVAAAGTLAVIAISAGLAGGFLVRPLVGLVLTLYVLLQVLYNLLLKRHAVLDIFSIAAGFVLRAVAGGAAAHVALSGWFLICTSLGALFLGIEKRRQEIKVLGDAANEHRKSFQSYSIELLDRMEAVVVPSLVTSYAIYCYFSPSSQWMLLTIPFVLYGVFRYQLLSTLGSLTGSPEEVLLKDRGIQASIVAWVLTAAGVVYGWIPSTFTTVTDMVDSIRLF